MFHFVGDERPENRREKLTHNVGSVAKVEWRKKGQNSFTGMFADPLLHGIVRLSHIRQPDPAKLLTSPAMSLKMFRDGRHSANLVAQYSVESQESWNFFKNDLSN